MTAAPTYFIGNQIEDGLHSFCWVSLSCLDLLQSIFTYLDQVVSLSSQTPSSDFSPHYEENPKCLAMTCKVLHNLALVFPSPSPVALSPPTLLVILAISLLFLEYASPAVPQGLRTCCFLCFFFYKFFYEFFFCPIPSDVFIYILLGAW